MSETRRSTRGPRRAALAGAAAGALACALGAAPAMAQDADSPHAVDTAAVAAQWGLLETYCTECHNFTDWAGEVAFDTMLPENVPEEAEVWEQVIRKLNGGLMPPPGKPRPGAGEAGAFVAALETTLDAAAEGRSDPGFVGLHRLNRAEYANAVRDLLGVEVNPAELLPQDNKQDGFDNIASALTVTPSFMEQYVGAARSVALTAIGDGAARPSAATFVNANPGALNRHVPGLPLGTRGGVVGRHYFPADGEYVVNIADMAQALWVYDMEYINTVVVTLDGVPVYETEIGGDQDQKAIDQYGVGAADQINQRLKDIRFEATAGPHDVGVAFLARSFAESERRLRDAVPGGIDTVLQVSSFEIRGPFNPAGVSDSAPRERIFTCVPEAAEEERACAEEIISGLARRAYRRPVDGADLQPLMAFYDQAASADGHEAGVRQALTAILASPDFLYRFVSTPDDAAPGSVHALDDIEMASRLSFFLWSSIPDAELLDAAEAGSLGEPDVLAAQVRRMLADERARALVTGFAFQWLDMAMLDEVVPDGGIFPHAAGSADPRDDYRQELALFVESIVREDRPVGDLLTADHTFVNERIARMYGIAGVRGEQFRRITLDDPTRFGLLGKGAFLVSSSYPNRTAPVLRGKFVMENILGAPPSPPPPGVDTDLTESDPNAAPLTVRERLMQHRADPSCNSCHGIMDPLGLALENFTAVGEWRRTDLFSGQVIDSSGELPDGTLLAGPVDLREALIRDPSQFAQTVTEQLMIFALGRSLTAHDMPTVRAIVREAAADDYRISSLVLGVIRSDAFGKITVPGADAAPVQEASFTPSEEAQNGNP